MFNLLFLAHQISDPVLDIVGATESILKPKNGKAGAKRLCVSGFPSGESNQARGASPGESAFPGAGLFFARSDRRNTNKRAKKGTSDNAKKTGPPRWWIGESIIFGST